MGTKKPTECVGIFTFSFKQQYILSNIVFSAEYKMSFKNQTFKNNNNFASIDTYIAKVGES